MARTASTAEYVVQIGPDVYSIYGDDQSGWSFDESDLHPNALVQFRYGSLDELLFALLNLNLVAERGD